MVRCLWKTGTRAVASKPFFLVVWHANVCVCCCSVVSAFAESSLNEELSYGWWLPLKFEFSELRYRFDWLWCAFCALCLLCGVLFDRLFSYDLLSSYALNPSRIETLVDKNEMNCAFVGSSFVPFSSSAQCFLVAESNLLVSKCI